MKAIYLSGMVLTLLGTCTAATIAQAHRPVSRVDLTQGEQRQLRCTMIASAVAYDVERGAETESFGLTSLRAKALGDELERNLAAAHGATPDEIRAMLKADFENASAQAASDEASWQGRVQKQAADCADIWGEKVEIDSATQAPPPTLLPTQPAMAHKQEPDSITITPSFCFALNSAFSSALIDRAGRDTAISMTFARRANRIEKLMIARAGGGDAARAAVGEELDKAIANFDVDAFDALVEEEAEEKMVACEVMAGPEED